MCPLASEGAPSQSERRRFCDTGLVDVVQPLGSCGRQHEVWCLSWQVLMEIAGETMSQMAAAPKQRREQPAAVASEEDTELEDDLQARLEAVRS